MGMKEGTTLCAHCHERIDVRWRVCPHCNREQPRKGPPQWLVLVVLIIGGCLFIYVAGARNAQSPDCATLAAEHKDLAEDLMVEYLRAHTAGNAAMMGELRRLADQMEMPDCARAAKGAMLSWMTAVDEGDQAGMTAADERFLLAFE